MHVFNSYDEAIEWGLDQNPGKYDFYNTNVGSEDVILCGTNLVYEDVVWSKVEEAYLHLVSLLPEYKRNERYDYVDCISEIRDYILEYFEKTEEVQLLDVYKEY